MKYRKLTENGDYAFGRGGADMHADTPEAVGQAGYLVGSVDRFNDAKAAEVRDRVTHINMKGVRNEVPQAR